MRCEGATKKRVFEALDISAPTVSRAGKRTQVEHATNPKGKGTNAPALLSLDKHLQLQVHQLRQDFRLSSEPSLSLFAERAVRSLSSDERLDSFCVRLYKKGRIGRDDSLFEAAAGRVVDGQTSSALRSRATNDHAAIPPAEAKRLFVQRQSKLLEVLLDQTQEEARMLYRELKENLDEVG